MTLVNGASYIPEQGFPIISTETIGSVEYWRRSFKYVLDASVIIDNKADALYIANAGKQNAIFDLGEFNEIKTSEGIEELKQSGSYDIDKSNVRQSDNVKLVEGFEGARMASEGGTN